MKYSEFDQLSEDEQVRLLKNQSFSRRLWFFTFVYAAWIIKPFADVYEKFLVKDKN